MQVDVLFVGDFRFPGGTSTSIASEARALAAASSAPPPAPEPVRTVDMVCAGSSNFIAREVCRSRECGNPAFVNDPVCVRFREVEAANRRQPTN